ncbi:MAG: CotH kinase family protein [Bacteroidota bacterium]|nr:CotH kinase family protein [Bacteroidota bacterium]
MKNIFFYLSFLLSLMPLKGLYCQVLINEISNANHSLLFDKNDKTNDWIELYNAGSTSINLLNYSLTDNSQNLKKWIFPNISIGAFSFVIVLASGKDTLDDFVHTNFKLAAKGEEVILSNPAGIIIDKFSLGYLHSNHSVGRKTDGGNELCHFDTPSPGKSNINSLCYQGYEEVPFFSLSSGFYEGSQILSLSTSSSTGQVRYTVSGKFTDENDKLYTIPIVLDSTTVITARVFSTVNKLPGRPVKNTFFIDEYELDLPVISISLDPKDLWDWNEGMYVMGPGAATKFPHHGANFWQDWEKTAHIEYFNKDKKQEFSQGVGLKIRGGHSRAYPQRSFTVKVRGKYGKKEINYPLITEKPHITSYQNFVLRNGGQDYRFVRYRDAFAHRVVKNTHIDIMSYEPVLVFLNGAYWGHYGLRDRQDEDYIENNHGFPADQVDLLNHTPHGRLHATKGSLEYFYKMYDFITKSNPDDPEFYTNSSKLLDLENFTDYFLTEIHYGNDDWIDHTTSCNNIKLWRPQLEAGRWRYMMYDLDKGLGGRNRLPSYNNLSMVHKPDGRNVHSDIFESLLKNQQFRIYFINRYADLINTVFQPDNMRKIAYQMRDELDSSIKRHFTIWSGSYGKWLEEIEMMLDFNEQRLPLVRKHIQGEFSLIKQVDVILNVIPSDAGMIKISTIIPDSLPWRGVYFDGAPVTLTAIANPGFTFEFWQANDNIFSNNFNESINLNISSDDTFTAFFTGEPSNIKSISAGLFNLKVWPNPSSDLITINIISSKENLRDMSFAMYDFTGNEVKKISSITNDQLILNRNEFSPGIYIIKIGNSESFVTEKIVFQ